MASRGNLGGLIKLALVVVLIYLGYNEILPRVRESLGGFGNRGGEATFGEGEGAACVAQAAAASRAFGANIGRFTRAGEVDAWDDHRWVVEGQIDEAEDTCGCGQPSCEKAHEALGQLRVLIDELDPIVRSETIATFNPARHQERIDNLLDSARDLARRGR